MKRCFSIYAALLIGMAACSVSGAETDYKIMVLGDLHYAAAEYYPMPHPGNKRAATAKEYVKMWKSHSLDLLRAAGKLAAAESPAFMIQLGDLTNGDCETEAFHEKMFRDGFRLLKSFFPGIPLYAVVGNHDVRQLHGESPEPVKKGLLPLIASELNRKELQSGNYSFRRGKDLFIAIDCFSPDGKCLDFIREKLHENPDTRYVFLLTHLPLFPVAVVNPLSLIPHADQIADLLEKRKALVLAAHTHKFSMAARETVHGGKLSQIVITSMGNAWHNNPHLNMDYTWETYLDILRKRLSGGKKDRKVLQTLNDIAGRGRYTAQFFERKSGFVLLHIDDHRVEARIYLDDSGKPARILTVAENR